MREAPLTFARNLRNNATSEERALWHALSRIRPRWTRQFPIGPYVADFACQRARLVVELDGSQHVGSRSDERRASALEADGWRVLRFWNGEVHENLDGVVEAIIDAAEPRLPEGETFDTITHRAGRDRRPRTRK